ncbi:MAG: HAMP domain-containing histidine kinase [Planctomycetaceae bacterium]|nr:HAMP domain-containing histidine kinase [Planctomycetaceae bacterium]
MRVRPIILMILIVTLPLLALTWAALRLIKNENLVVEQRFRVVMEERMEDVRSGVRSYVDELERHFDRVASIDDFAVDELRKLNRSEPQLAQLFVLDPRGELLYPNPADPLNADERLFLIQAARMFTGADLKAAIIQSEQPLNKETAGGESAVPRERDSAELRSTQNSRFSESRSDLSRSEDGAAQRVPILPDLNDAELQQQLVQEAYPSAAVRNIELFAESSGWFPWYWDRGLNLIYWQRRPSGHIVGCALERARWIADLIAKLPETVATPADSSATGFRKQIPDPFGGLQSRIRLINSSAASVYQWGRYEPEEGSRPLCDIPLDAPLASWRLQCLVPREQLTAGTGRSAYVGLFAGMAAVLISLAVMVGLFFREYFRDIKEASRQVSFVNQVSHELKTPLTNIRMYAELLERDLDNIPSSEASPSRKRLDVILSESQRLSRLISNVLTFARSRRKTLVVQPRPIVPAETISAIVDRFRPILSDHDINIDVSSSVTDDGNFDPDVIDQILSNLISNVEKYATAGKLMKICSRMEQQTLFIDVIDSGPGVADSLREKIFEPFTRGSNEICSAAGTGIGLTIARELAQLHSGNVVLLPSAQGCHFQVTLQSLDVCGQEINV